MSDDPLTDLVLRVVGELREPEQRIAAIEQFCGSCCGDVRPNWDEGKRSLGF
jgi:hypothetical protein